jgi:hypothetical protein
MSVYPLINGFLRNRAAVLPIHGVATFKDPGWPMNESKRNNDGFPLLIHYNIGPIPVNEIIGL